LDSTKTGFKAGVPDSHHLQNRYPDAKPRDPATGK
jgi:uncharacterized cupin superfamily protein